MNLRTLCPLAKEFNSVGGIWGILSNVFAKDIALLQHEAGNEVERL